VEFVVINEWVEHLIKVVNGDLMVNDATRPRDYRPHIRGKYLEYMHLIVERDFLPKITTPYL
jgi:hypothetical protein